MKKLLLSLGMFAVLISCALAQPNLCKDDCTEDSLKTMTIPLCTFTNTVNYTPPINGNEIITDAPFVFVIINYRIKTCPGGIKSVIIDDYVFVDNRDFWETVWGNQFLPGCVISNPTIIPPPATLGCIYPAPPTTNSMKAAVADAITKLLNKEGITTQAGGYDVFFKGACYSLVTLSFPNGAFFAGVPNDLGHIDTFYVSAGSKVSQNIPCNDVCCKVTYNWVTTTLANGETTSRWKPVSAAGDGGLCEIQPFPDYNIYPKKLQAKIYDPATGLYNTVTGSFVSQTNCELICPHILAPPPPDGLIASVKTDKISKDVYIELSAYPIPFNNLLHFTSKEQILKVVMYDISGRKVLSTTSLDNGELNTSELKVGSYYVQVYLPNNIVKSIKVIKQ
ncbi:MAG: T9SS type A sorting domain-containing protein [Bacteroidia bacterium]|nr:T9SS type A sorting domain-containing protein [Bacteroidia bacterium]